MKSLLTIMILVLGFAAQTAEAGSNSSPLTNGYVEMSDGSLIDRYQSPQAIAARAAAEAEAAARRADDLERPILAQKYIAQNGRARWEAIGRWKNVAELRGLLGVVGVAAVVGASVGASDSAQAASVRMAPNSSGAVTQLPAPNTTPSYQTYRAAPRNTAN